MAEDLISSIIDEPAIKIQFEALNKQLDTILVKLKTISTDGSFGNTSNLKSVIKETKAYEQTTSELSAAQIKLLSINKELDNSVKNALAANTKRTVLSTEFGKVLKEEQLLLQKANAEAKTQVQINGSVTGSLDNINSRLKKLRSERGSIAPVTAEDIKRMDELKNRIENLEQIRSKRLDSRQAQANNVGNYEGSAKIIVDALEKEKIKLQSLTSSYKTFGAEVTNARTIIAGFGGTASKDDTKKFCMKM